jgi:hypothetical protein
MALVISKELKKYSLQNGLILGLILLSFNIISFYLITTVVKSPLGVIGVPYLFSVILPIPLSVIFCYRLRATIGYPWDFRIATSGIFILFMVAYLIIFIGRDLVFSKLIEPKMNTKIENVLLATTPIALKESGANPKQIADKQNEIKAQFAAQDNTSIRQELQSLVTSVIFIFIFALIFGAFFKTPVRGYGVVTEGGPGV